MRNSKQIDGEGQVHEDPSNHQIKHEAETDSVQNNMAQAVNSLIKEIDNERELRTVIRIKDKELEIIFNQILWDLDHGHCTMLEINSEENLPKHKLTSDIEESTNRILNEYLQKKISLKFRQGLCSVNDNWNIFWDSAERNWFL